MIEHLDNEQVFGEIQKFLIAKYAGKLPRNVVAMSAIREVDPPDRIERQMWRILEDLPLVATADGVPGAFLAPPTVDLRRDWFEINGSVWALWHGAGKATIYFAKMWVGEAPLPSIDT